MRLKSLRAVVGGLFAALMSAHAVRSAAVAAYAEKDPEVAGSVWRDHPDTIASISMIEVAQAAGRGLSVPASTSERLNVLATRSPLAPEPFLIMGANELRSQNYSKAEQLLLTARHRDPRSIAARYLLSDLYLRENKASLALEQLVALNRLSPPLGPALVPAMAKYAQTAGATPRLRQVLRDDAQLLAAVLTVLASDHRNAALILSLAEPLNISDSARPWQTKLMSVLVAAGEYRRAFLLWRRFAPPADTRAPLSQFYQSSLPSPFTWTFAEGAAGAVEPDNGTLRVNFTGRADVTFASRVTLLPAGSYLMRIETSGEMPPDGNVSWSVTCLSEGRRPVANVPLTRSGKLTAQFNVAPDCDAQMLELRGAGQSFPERAEFSIKDFQVKRTAR